MNYKRSTFFKAVLLIILITIITIFSITGLVTVNEDAAQASQARNVSDIISSTESSLTLLIDGVSQTINNSLVFLYIESVEDWKKVAAITNGTDGFTANNLDGFIFELQTDLDFGWDGVTEIENNFTPIGANTVNGKSFSARNFNGNNYVISGIYYETENSYAGLFGVVEGETYDIAIEDIIVENSYFSSSDMAGGIAGYVSGDETVNIVIDNCHFNGTVEAPNAGGIAGVTATCSTSSLSLYGAITNCSVRGKIAGSGNVGGIIGYDIGVPVINCCNEAVIYGKYENNDLYIGGIIGNSAYRYSLEEIYGNLIIFNCYNTGNINVTTSDAVAYTGYFGGIAGYLRGYSNAEDTAYGYIYNCYNKGDMSSINYQNSNVNAGEIAGNLVTSIIKYCYYEYQSYRQVVNGASPSYDGNDIYPFTKEASEFYDVAGMLGEEGILNSNIETVIAETGELSYSPRLWIVSNQPTNGGYPILEDVTPIRHNLTLIDGTEQTATVYTEARNTKLPVLTKSGYTFGNWYITDTLTGSAMDIIGKDMTIDLVLYSKWTLINYSITYSLNDGINASSNLTTYNVETGTISLATPTKDGYTFGGWYTNAEFSGDAVTTVAASSIGGMTFYAKWTTNSDGSSINPVPDNLLDDTANGNKENLWWLWVLIAIAVLIIAFAILYILQKKGKIHIAFLDKIFDKITEFGEDIKEKFSKKE